MSFVAAIKARYLAEFAQLRPSGDGLHRHPDATIANSTRGVQVSEFAGDEIAVELGISRNAACRELATALSVTTHLTNTLAALQAGQINPVKAQIICETTAGISNEIAVGVQNQVLPKAPRLTPGQLRSLINRTIAALDTDGVQQRHTEAMAQRRVILTPAPDGMAELWALLPADKATALYQRITKLAHTAKTPDDTRGIDARRADVLADMPGTIDKASPTPEEVGNSSATGVQLHVTVSAGTLLGLDDQPGYLAGYGSISAAMSRQLAADATWRRILADPITGQLLDYGRTTYRPPVALADHIRARDATCRFPGCRQPARSCDIDHVTAYDRGGTTSPNNLATLCRHHHRLKHHAGWSLTGNPNGTLTWATPTGRQHNSTPEPLVPALTGRPTSDSDPPPF